MSAIPFEILTLTFKQLECIDLTQCQLVCKSWNQASLKLLYSDVKIHSEKGSELYVRTIKSSPHLGKYLEVIKADIIERDEEEDEYENDSYRGHDDSEEEKDRSFNIWDRYDLLNAVIHHCPNVLKILNSGPSSSFFTRLVNAGLQNQLSRLQYVSGPGSDSFYDYVNTVLLFKRTLKTIEIPNTYSEDLLEEEAYPILCKNLNQFPCLQTLKMMYHINYRMSHYDSLIDDCKHLTNLSMHSVSYSNVPSTTESIQTIQQHYKIETIQCSWAIINTDDQITYLLQKFPNLKSLIINHSNYHGNNVGRFSVNTLIKFFRFIFSLKNSFITTVLNQDDCVNSWAPIINENSNTIDIEILISDSSFIERTSNVETVKSSFNGQKLTFHIYSYTDYHIRLLSKVGRKVRSLILDIHNRSSTMYILSRGQVENLDRIVELIDFCPSLQNLKLGYVPNLSFSGGQIYQNYGVENLSLHKYDNSMGSLEGISFMFPNLKNLHLSVPYQYGDSKTIIINMPNTSFNILTCSMMDGRLWGQGTSKVYIRLNTEAGLQFYSATKNQLQQIHWKKCGPFLHLDINCRSLTKLKLDTCNRYTPYY